MNEISPQQLLTQIRSMHAELESVSPLSNSYTGNAELDSVTPLSNRKPANVEFSALIKNAVGQVNEAQSTAATMSRDFASGAGDASLAEVMIAAQKADLSFRAVTEVRNKLVTAYQEIMNMPV